MSTIVDTVELEIEFELKTAIEQLALAETRYAALQNLLAEAIEAEGEVMAEATKFGPAVAQALNDARGGDGGSSMIDLSDQQWRKSHPAVVRVLNERDAIDQRVRAAGVRTTHLAQTKQHLEAAVLPRLRGLPAALEEKLANHRLQRQMAEAATTQAALEERKPSLIKRMLGQA